MKTTISWKTYYDNDIFTKKVEIPEDIKFYTEDPINPDVKDEMVSYITVLDNKKHVKTIKALNKLSNTLDFNFGDYTIISFNSFPHESIKTTNNIEEYCNTIGFNIKNYLIVRYNDNCIPTSFFRPFRFTSLSNLRGIMINATTHPDVNTAEPNFLSNASCKILSFTDVFTISNMSEDSTIKIFKDEGAAVIYTTVLHSLFSQFNAWSSFSPEHYNPDFARMLVYGPYVEAYDFLGIKVKHLF